MNLLATQANDVMCEVNLEHTKNVVIEKGKKASCLETLRALHGCIESALRCHGLCSEILCEEVFIINPHDRCMANKVINAKQHAIVCHVDENKASHVDPIVVTEVIGLIKTLWVFDSDQR